MVRDVLSYDEDRTGCGNWIRTRVLCWRDSGTKGDIRSWRSCSVAMAVWYDMAENCEEWVDCRRGLNVRLLVGPRRKNEERMGRRRRGEGGRGRQGGDPGRIVLLLQKFHGIY
jgi:hypothetical protein